MLNEIPDNDTYKNREYLLKGKNTVLRLLHNQEDEKCFFVARS